MSTLPPFKLRRELGRLARQVIEIPSLLFDTFLSALFHDLFERPKVRRFDGKVARGDRVAIYLVFARDGLLPSHKHAIGELRRSGYAPLVVSNLPFTENDCEWLTENAWKFLSRTNRGYDFGGYREGFLTLGDDAKDLAYLAFFNDSSWFPLTESSGWLAQAEELDVDFAAAASSFGVQRVALQDFRDIEWKLDSSRKNFHYCSYALLVGSRVLKDTAYYEFWKRLTLSSNKNRVVRQGEIGMTRFVLRRGYSHAATYDIGTLPDRLEGLSDQQINRVARTLITLGDPHTKTFLGEVVPTLDAQRSAEDRRASIQLILTVAARIGISYVLPEFLYDHHEFQFLKKSPVALDARDSAIMREFSKTLAGSYGRVIEKEMDEIRHAKGFR